MTQDEIIEMAKQVGMDYIEYISEDSMKQVKAFVNLVAAKEREACAKIVEDSPSYDWHKFACEAAYAIRARGQA